MRDILIDLDDYDVGELCESTIIRENENNASQFKITLNDEFTGYSYRLNFQVNRETPFNTLDLTPVDGVITYAVTNVMTYLSGTLKMELQAFKNNDLIKSVVFIFKITPAIEGIPVIIPEEYQSYLDLRNHSVMSVNTIEPVNGDVTLDTDDIAPTLTRKYVPLTPVTTPTKYFLNGNNTFSLLDASMVEPTADRKYVPTTPASPTEKFLNGNNQFVNLPVAYAETYGYNNTGVQSIPSGTGYTVLTQSTANGSSYGMTADYVNRKIIAQKHGMYLITGYFSSIIGTNGVTWETVVLKNGNACPNIHGIRYIQNANNETVTTICGLLELNVGEYISVAVRHNNGSAVNITSKYMNVNAVMIREIV